MKGHKSHHHGRHHKAEGGRTGLVASGNPDVLKEAKGEESYDKGDERKRGGKVKKKHHRATGGKVLGLMTGGGVKPRMDRVARKRGGAVGADRMPFSGAHRTTSPDKLPKSQEGGASD